MGSGRAKQVPFVKLAFYPGNGAFFELKKPFFADHFCPNATKQSILAKTHFFTRSQNLEGEIVMVA